MTSKTKTQAQDLPKFRRRAKHRPDEVLDAALDLFTRQGYSNTSVDEVARLAGISKGAVYLYFPSKQAILEGLITRAVQPVSAQVLAGITNRPGGFREAATFFLKTLARRLGEPDVLAIPKIIMREAVVAPEIAEMYRHAVLDHAIPMLSTMIEAAVARGELRAVDPELAVRSVMGPVIAHLFLAEVFAIQPDSGLEMEKLIDTHLTILFDGLSNERSRDDD